MVVSLPASSSSPSSTSTNFEFPICNSISFQQNSHNSTSKVSFLLNNNPKVRLFSKNLSKRIVTSKAQLNKAALDGSNHAPVTSQGNSVPLAEEQKNDEPSSESSSALSASEESISQFMSQVSSLIKLVDSRDIVELKLKQLDCEILIRKEAIPQSQAPISAHMVTTQAPLPVAPSPAPAPSPSSPALALPAPAPAAKSASPSLPVVKSPMSGTFYRSPGPGEPPFVKVGDKVKKGQVVCIIEAMKLMNEIEADQSGTVVEIHAEDGKPVTIDSPLLVIQP